MTDGICPFADINIAGQVVHFSAGSTHRVGFCDHTAAGFYAGALALPQFWNQAGYSVHFGISLAGEICQIVNIFDRAWGQGRDARGKSVGPASPNIAWTPFREMGQVNPNEYLISIEHEDHYLNEQGQSTFNGSVWTDEMFAADLRLKRWCVDEVGRVMGQDLLRFGEDSLAGHHMFDHASRANCPGSHWRDGYRSRLIAALSTGAEIPASSASAELPQARAQEPPGDTYVLQPGDTLLDVALRFGLSLAELLTANPSVTDPDRVDAGTSLRIPGTATAIRADYVVKPGDTLTALAREWGCAVAAIMAVNNVENADRIKAGDRLHRPK